MSKRLRVVFAVPLVVVTCIDPGSIAQADPPPVLRNPPPPNRNPPPPQHESVRARVIDIKVVDDHTVVTVSAGSSQGVDRTWTGHVVDGDGKPLPGRLTVIRVDKSSSMWQTDLTLDRLKQSPFVRLEQP